MCYDAPARTPCPTHIDIPKFIKKIATENLRGSARTILESNLLGATCARVCPVQELCEGACVSWRGAQAHRHRPAAAACDGLRLCQGNRTCSNPGKPQARKWRSLARAPRVSPVRANSRNAGHSVTLFEKRDLAGGLSTYGIIGLREPAEVARAEVAMIERLGVKTGDRQGNWERISPLPTCKPTLALCFSVWVWVQRQAWAFPGEEYIIDGLEYIEQSKLDAPNLVIGRNVVVIGRRQHGDLIVQPSPSAWAPAKSRWSIGATEKRDDGVRPRVRLHQA